MATVGSLLRKFQALDTDQVAVQAIENSKELMADLNAEQINSGLRSDGTLMPDYSIRSVVQYGKPYGPIRLRDTGAWQQGMYVTVHGDNVVFSSTDSKDRHLVDKYGTQIQGLSDKYKNEAIRESIRPSFMRQIKEQTGL